MKLHEVRDVPGRPDGPAQILTQILEQGSQEVRQHGVAAVVTDEGVDLAVVPSFDVAHEGLDGRARTSVVSRARLLQQDGQRRPVGHGRGRPEGRHQPASTRTGNATSLKNSLCCHRAR